MSALLAENRFPNSGIGRGGSVLSPPIVYSEKLGTLDHLTQRIAAFVSFDTLKSTWAKVYYRLDVHRATNGAHIEKYQGTK